MTSNSGPSSNSPESQLAALHRASWGRLLAALVTRTRRLDLAEDALGEAFARAAAGWPVNGVPPNPSGWLYRTAYRLVIGGLRSEAVAARHGPLLAVREGWVAPPLEEDELPDERLQLILLCCHPALSPASRSALALRLVLGTPTEEIARLFLARRAAMAARITRAKKKIVEAGIPLGRPAAQELEDRLDEVCRTLYLAFTAGYTPGSGTRLLRADLAGEAVRLAAILATLVPGAPQVESLLALLMLQHARRDARERDGQLVTLAEQDRALWHRREIAQGWAMLAALPPAEGYAEELRLQALIAGEHVRAASAKATDWARIAGHYAALEALTRSPIVRLNRAIAVAERDGPSAGLALLSGLEAALGNHHRLYAVRAELARRAGDLADARAAFERALTLSTNDVETRFLRGRLDALDG